MSRPCPGRTREYSLGRVDCPPVPVGNCVCGGSDGSLIRSSASETHSIVQGPLHVLIVFEEALPRLHDLVNSGSLRWLRVPAPLDEISHRIGETKIPRVPGKFRSVTFQYPVRSPRFTLFFEWDSARKDLSDQHPEGEDVCRS